MKQNGPHGCPWNKGHSQWTWSLEAWSYVWIQIHHHGTPSRTATTSAVLHCTGKLLHQARSWHPCQSKQLENFPRPGITSQVSTRFSWSISEMWLASHSLSANVPSSPPKPRSCCFNFAGCPFTHSPGRKNCSKEINSVTKDTWRRLKRNLK